MKKTFLILITIFMSMTLKSQAQDAWSEIDSLLNLQLPKSAIEKINVRYKKSIEQKNDEQIIKSLIYLNFCNCQIESENDIEQIRELQNCAKTVKSPIVQSVVQSLIGAHYYNYYNYNRWKFANRTNVDGEQGDDVETWSLGKILSEIFESFQKSLEAKAILEKTKIEDYSDFVVMNSGAKKQGLTLYDLLAQQAISIMQNSTLRINQPKNDFYLDKEAYFTPDPKEFSEMEIPTTNKNSSLYFVISTIKDLTCMHLQRNDNKALGSLYFQRLDFLKNNYTSGDALELVNKSLQSFINRHKVDDVWFEAVYKLAKNYSQNNKPEALKYCDMAFKRSEISKTQREVFQSLVDNINVSQLRAYVDNFNIPNVPVKVKLEFANVDTVYLRLYKLNKVVAWNDERKDFLKNKEEYLTKNAILSHAWNVKMPKTDDYITHSTEIALDPLIHGQYILLTSDAPTFFQSENKTVNYNEMQVSDIAYTLRNRSDNKTELYLADISTGKPLLGAIVKGKNIPQNLITGKDGFLSFDVDYNKIGNWEIIYKNQQIYIENTFRYGDGYPYDYDVDGDDYDDDENYEAVFFTDRAIYRPGQVVYYKVLLIDKSKNIPAICANKKIDVSMFDTNDSEISKITLKTNDYGTCNGSFVVPQNILGGEFYLGTDYGSKTFRVEDYKRPTFEININKPEENPQFGEKVKLTGNAKSYSGYNIDNAKVSYNITRKFEFPYRWWIFPFDRSIKQIAQGETTTDENGNFQIEFFANGKDLKNDNQIAVFNVSAEITDNNGETHTANYTVRISKKPLVIKTEIKQSYYTEENIIANITTQNLSEEFSQADVELKIILLKSPDKVLRERLWSEPDKPLLTEKEYKKLFPNDVYKNEDDEGKEVVKIIKFNTKDTTKIDLNFLKKNGSAQYKLEIKAKTPNGIETSTHEEIYVTNKRDVIRSMKNWVTVANETDNYIEFYVSGPTEKSNVRCEVFYLKDIVETRNVSVSPKPQIVRFTKPKIKNSEAFCVNFLQINNARIYQHNQLISKKIENKLNLQFVTFRDKLSPGEKEQWKLNIKSATGDRVSAEMVASLYDESLDTFAPNHWDYNLDPQVTKYTVFWTNPIKADYSNCLNSVYPKPIQNFPISVYRIFNNNDLRLNLIKKKYENNPIKAEKGKICGFVFDENGDPIIGALIAVEGKKVEVASNSDGFYSIKAEIGDVLTFSYVGAETKKVVVDAQAIKRLNVELSCNSAFLEYGAVTAFYGYSVAEDSQFELRNALIGRASGVKSRSESSPFDEKQSANAESKTYPDVQIRTNFNETAFFYPELRTNESGEIVIDFTIPEALTRWKMLGFAHTKKMEYGYIAAHCITQKEVAISANAPRFFREGDKIEFSAKINNITAKTIEGKAKLELFNALTMQPINIIEGGNEQDFTIKTNQSSVVKWKLAIPQNLEAITYRIFANTDKHSDGEEKTLLVLPNSMLVTESMPFTVRGNQDKNFNFEKFIENKSNTLQNYTYTVELTSNPVWYAVEALPYLMEYPYECSEQICSRFYANTISKTILDKFPQIKRTFDLWKIKKSDEFISKLEKNQELKSVIIEETPWLRDAQNESESKKRIALLFDLNKMRNEQKTALDKLRKLQKPNGAFSWFNGMCESQYITQNIAINLQHLEKMCTIDKEIFATVNEISKNAIKWLDTQTLNFDIDEKKNVEKSKLTPLNVYYLYLRSFIGIADLKGNDKKAFDCLYSQLRTKWKDAGIYQQAIMAITLNRFGDTNTAVQIIKSLKERSKISEGMGMYWENNKRGYFWYQAPIETQALLIEAFNEISKNKKDVEEMKIWLLQNKQTNNWRTTTATADACYALLATDNMIDNNKLLEVKLNGKTIEKLKSQDLSEAETGSGYMKMQWNKNEIKKDLGKINIYNPNSNIAWGAAYWQYFEDLNKITSSEAGIKIQREYFVVEKTDESEKIRKISENDAVKLGDKVRVRMELRVDRDYEYVHLKDMRASGFEPVNVLSQSKCQDGLWYYEETKDASTNFFIYHLPKGVYVFEYDLRANNTGCFSTGIAIFQCMYAPEFSAHSKGMMIKIEK